jgi:pilus assembly protein Flp/PilA
VVQRGSQVLRYGGHEYSRPNRIAETGLIKWKCPSATVRRGRVSALRGSAPLQNGFGMIGTLKAFLSNQDGATAIEYALIASLIAVFLIGALTALGTSLSSEFAEVGAALK